MTDDRIHEFTLTWVWKSGGYISVLCCSCGWEGEATTIRSAATKIEGHLVAEEPSDQKMLLDGLRSEVRSLRRKIASDS